MKASDILIVNGRTNFDAEPIRRPSGHIIIEGSVVADTIQCKHCGGHWIPIKGSGIRRGWCTNCNGALCGSESCMTCMDHRKKMDRYEKGLIKTLK